MYDVKLPEDPNNIPTINNPDNSQIPIINTQNDPYQLPEAPLPIVKNNKKSRESLKSIASTLSIIIIAPLIALTITKFVFQSYQVDGPSMESTLQDQDRLIVSKIQRTISQITGNAYIPHRGDIVIFSEGGIFGINQTKQLIKRVIGVPGDRIIVKDGTITVYNASHPNGFQPDKTMSYGKVIKNTSGNIDVKISENEVFVCGDNRANSLDSRSFGPVPVNQIIGKLAYRVFPFNNAQSF